jgi:hypothetical protein
MSDNNKVQVARSGKINESLTEIQLAKFNITRKVFMLYNSSSGVLVIGLGPNAVSATDYTCKVFQNGFIELDGWAGEVRGYWETAPADGGAYVTEIC